MLGSVIRLPTKRNIMLDFIATVGAGKRTASTTTPTVVLFVLLLLSVGASVSWAATSLSNEDPTSLLRDETLQRQARIIGGDYVNLSDFRYPYFTSLEDYCGGALITPSIVVSAAHVSPSFPSRGWMLCWLETSWCLASLQHSPPRALTGQLVSCVSPRLVQWHQLCDCRSAGCF